MSFLLLIIKGVLRLIVFASVFWLCAGRVDLPLAWAYWGVWLGFMVVGLLCIGFSTRFRELALERNKPGPGAVENLKTLLVITLACLLGHWVIAGLDIGRLHFSDTVPRAVQVIGLVVMAAGMMNNVWTAVANPFASSVVRIQTDRGHHVITSGPYRFVRHPMYLGGILIFFGGAFALGSWLSFAPLAVLLVLGVRRTLMEDAYLKDNLAGYAEYAQRVRSRLVPGLW